MAFVFAGALVMALAVPMFGSVGTTQAIVHPGTPLAMQQEGQRLQERYLPFLVHYCPRRWLKGR